MSVPCMKARAYTCRCSLIAYKCDAHKLSRCANFGVTVSLVLHFPGRSDFLAILRFQTVGAVELIRTPSELGRKSVVAAVQLLRPLPFALAFEGCISFRCNHHSHRAYRI